MSECSAYEAQGAEIVEAFSGARDEIEVIPKDLQQALGTQGVGADGWAEAGSNELV
jgi:hypothetical protein